MKMKRPEAHADEACGGRVRADRVHRAAVDRVAHDHPDDRKDGDQHEHRAPGCSRTAGRCRGRRAHRRRAVWPFATTFERPRNAASVPSVVISALTPDDGDEEAVEHADADRRRDADEHGEPEAVAESEVRDDHGRERRDRADGEVELAGGHQHRPGRGDDPDHGDRGEDVDPVVPRRGSTGDLSEKKIASPIRKTISAADSGSRRKHRRARAAT